MTLLKVACSPYGINLWRRWLRRFNMNPIDGKCGLCGEPYDDQKIMRLHPQYPESWGHRDCIFDKVNKTKLLEILDGLVEKSRQEKWARKPQ